MYSCLKDVNEEIEIQIKSFTWRAWIDIDVLIKSALFGITSAMCEAAL